MTPRFDVTLDDDDAVLHCVLADGESVTVLVVDGEPLLARHPTDVALMQVVRSDGTVIVDDVVSVRPGGAFVRRARLLRRAGQAWLLRRRVCAGGPAP